MLELVIVACLAEPGPCREYPLLYDPGEVTLFTCLAAGQVEVARWHEAHSQWNVVRWRCGYAAPGRADI